MTKNSYKNEIMSVSHTISPTATRDAHYHEHYEILFFIKGDVNYFIEGADYWLTNGGLLMIPPSVLHGIKDYGNQSYERYVLHLYHSKASDKTRELLKKAFAGERYFTVTEGHGIEQAIADIFEAAKTGIEGAAEIALSALLLKIIVMKEKSAGAKPVISVGKSVAEIIEYINTSFQRELSLDFLSAKFFISKHHLNKTFKKGTGVTVHEYIILKRLHYAKSLIQKGVPKTQAAELAGFSDYSSFYKADRKRKTDSD